MAATALGSFCKDDELAVDLVMDAGALEPLVDLAKRWRENEGLYYLVVSALAKMLHGAGRGHRDRAVALGLARPLAACLSSADAELVDVASEGLSYLIDDVDNPEGRRTNTALAEQIFSESPASQLVALIEAGSHADVSSTPFEIAEALVLNLIPCVVVPAHQRVLLKAGLIPALLDAASPDPSPPRTVPRPAFDVLAYPAFDLLDKFLREHVAVEAADAVAATRSGLDLLAAALSSDDPTVRETASRCVWAIALADPRHHKATVAAGAAPRLVALLVDEDADVKESAASALLELMTTHPSVEEEALNAGFDFDALLAIT